MKTAVYQINAKYVHSSLAAWYLAASIRGRGYECAVLEGSINEPLTAHLERAAASGASVFALSCYIWNIELVLSLAEGLKRQDPDCIVILGGPEVGYRAESVLAEHWYVDYIISGEGEEPLAALVDSISCGEPRPHSDGICMRGHISAPHVSHIDPPSPYCDEYLERLNGRISYIETSRGCPYSCAYCLSCRDGVRFFDINRAKRDILTLARSGSKTVKFVDRTFNANRARSLELFRYMIALYREGEIPDEVTFHFEISGDLVDRETLDLLRSAPAGLFQLEIGVQSYNPDTLRAIHRHADTQRLSDVIRELSSYGNIHIHTDLIAGLPHEDIGSFRRSYDRLASLNPHKIQLGVLKLLYGSDMRERPDIYPCEYDRNAPYRVRSTPWLSEEDMREIDIAEKGSDGILYSGRFTRTVEYLMSESEMTPYELAYALGDALYTDGTPALDDLFDSMYEYCSRMKGVSPERLRDLMLCDRIAHNNSCVIPHSLRIADPRLREIADRLAEAYPRTDGTRRCIGILYTEGRVVFADYRDKHPVSGQYELVKVEMGELI